MLCLIFSGNCVCFVCYNKYNSTGDIVSVMNRDYFFGITSGVNAACGADLRSSFDVSSGMASVQFSAKQFANDSTCADVIPAYVGYIEQYDFDVFELEYDMKSAIVCIAINAGVMKFDVLTRVEELAYYMELDGRVFRYTERVNFHYIGMTPLRCFESMDKDAREFTGYNFCLLILGDTVMLPHFTHFYGCEDCSQMVEDCNYFDFLIGGIFFPIEPFIPYFPEESESQASSYGATNDNEFSTSMRIQSRKSGMEYASNGGRSETLHSTTQPPERKNTDTEFAREAKRRQFIEQHRKRPSNFWVPYSQRDHSQQSFTTSSFSEDATSIHSFTPDGQPIFALNNSINSLAGMIDLLLKHTPRELNAMTHGAAFDSAYFAETDSIARHEMFEFCFSDVYGYCSMLTFNAYDSRKQVSKYYHNVVAPACADTFTPSAEAWAAISNTPPTEFTQDYYACKASPADAFFNSMGIAAGNTSTLLPIAFLFIMPLVYTYLKTSGTMPPPKEYADDDVNDALKALGLMLLRINDGKTSAVKSNSTLMKLTNELVDATKVLHEHPDSDDDADSDGEGGDRGESDKTRANGRENTAPHARSSSKRKSVFDKGEMTPVFVSFCTHY